MKHKGFSLVELSIVLIIIGLLVAGVTGGSKLIQSAKLNKVINEITQINTAYTTFYQTYDALPGDITEAQSYWGSIGVNNGDGDRKVESIIGTLGTAALGDESSNAFHHLSLSGVLPGNYNVQIDQGTYTYESNLNSRAIIVNEKDSAGTSYGGFASNLSGENLLYFGRVALDSTRAALNPGVHSSFLKPKDAYKIDKKLDDGLSFSGRISFRDESAASTDGDVVTADCASGTGYKLTEDIAKCNLVYLLEKL